MAVLDPRLFDLLETLTRSRLDWLAMEVIDGIRAGRAVKDPPEALAAARKAIGSKAQPRVRGEPIPPTPAPQPIEADAQIEWAANYVGERLQSTLTQLDASLATLDEIVEGTQGDAESQAAKAPAESIAVLMDEDMPRKSRRDDVAVARASVQPLIDGLSRWSESVRTQTQP